MNNQLSSKRALMRQACHEASKTVRSMGNLLEFQQTSTLLHLRMVERNCGVKREPRTLHLFPLGSGNVFFRSDKYGDLMIVVDRPIEEIEASLQTSGLRMSLAFKVFYEAYQKLARQHAPAELQQH